LVAFSFVPPVPVPVSFHWTYLGPAIPVFRHYQIVSLVLFLSVVRRFSATGLRKNDCQCLLYMLRWLLSASGIFRLLLGLQLLLHVSRLHLSCGSKYNMLRWH